MTSHENNFDVLVLGSRAGAAATATLLARRGHRVGLVSWAGDVECAHQAESLTAHAADVVRLLGLDSDMDALGFPHKRGVWVIGTGAHTEFYLPTPRPSWHVRVDAFEALLRKTATQAGVVHLRGTDVHIDRDGSRIRSVRLSGDGSAEPTTYTARVILDGSATDRLLSRSRVATEAIADTGPPFVSLRTTMEHADQGDRPRSMLIFHGQPRHCAWWVPTSPTTTAICVSIPWSTWCQMGQEPNRAMAWGLDKLNPHLARRMKASEGHSTVEFERTEAYHMERFAGDGWMCVGRAHHAVHPVFSFGLSLELTDARAAADATHSALNTGRDALYFSRYMATSKVQHEAIEDLIRYFWRYPSFLAHKARGETRRELVRLFAGDVREGAVGLLGSMRTSLREAQLSRTGQPAQPRSHRPSRGRMRATPQPMQRSIGPWGRGRS